MLGLAGVAAAASMTRLVRHSAGRLALLGFAWGAATILTVGVPDVRWLAILAYAPILLVGGLIGWSPDRTLLDVITWPVVNQLLCIGGGVIWAKAALSYARVSSDRCAACGRSDDDPDVPRWAELGPARIAVAVAASVPLLCGATRWAWAIGIPLGVDAAQLEQVHADGFPVAPAGLGTMAFVGAALTLGLVQRWGVAFPRWLPLVGGRRVPVSMVVVPAVFVSLLVTGTGLAIVRLRLDDLTSLLLLEGWAVFGPGLVRPVWGVGLGVAAIAYHYRHRGRCAACGRGRS